MNEYVVAIITGLVVAAVAAAVIWYLWTRYKKEKAIWEQRAEDNYLRGKDEAAEIVRSTCDQIEEDKAKLAEFSDRELLIEIMLALGSYGRRIDRIDTKLKNITNYKAYIDDMNAMTHKLSQSFVVLEGNISTTSNVINGLRQTVNEASTNIQKLIVALGNLTDLQTQINDHVSNLSRVEKNLDYIHGQITAVVEDMDAVMNTYDKSPVARLKEIQQTIAELTDVVDSVQSELRTVSNTAGEIKTTIDDSMDEYSYDSLFYRIADVASKVGNLESELGSISSKVYDIKNTVENSLDSYGYNSLYSKLDAIESGVNSIQYKVDA